MRRPTHVLLAVVGWHDDSPRYDIVCRNDPDDLSRDCRHGDEANDCPDPEGCLHGWTSSEGVHVHAYTAKDDEDTCGLRWWLTWGSGLVVLDIERGSELSLPAEGTVRWDVDPVFVPFNLWEDR